VELAVPDDLGRRACFQCLAAPRSLVDDGHD
jgi:hypothetical protein